MPDNNLRFENGDNRNSGEERERFESDTQKIVRRHLQNEDDVITDEDIKNIRVGMAPPLDKPTEEAVLEREGKVADRKTPDEEETLPGSQKITPWDVVDPDA